MYLPEGITLCDPRAMKQQDILAVMKHIVDRQVVNKPDKVFPIQIGV